MTFLGYSSQTIKKEYEAVVKDAPSSNFFYQFGSTIRNTGTTSGFDRTYFFNESNINLNPYAKVIKNTLDFSVNTNLPSGFYHFEWDFHLTDTKDYLVPTTALTNRWYFSNVVFEPRWLYNYSSSTNWRVPLASTIDYFIANDKLTYTKESSGLYHTFWNVKITGEVTDVSYDPGTYTYTQKIPVIEIRMLDTSNNNVGLNFNIKRLKFTLTEYDSNNTEVVNLFKG